MPGMFVSSLRSFLRSFGTIPGGATWGRAREGSHPPTLGETSKAPPDAWPGEALVVRDVVFGGCYREAWATHVSPVDRFLAWASTVSVPARSVVTFRTSKEPLGAWVTA